MVRGGDFTPEQRRVLRVEQILHRDGGSPGSALEGLAAIVEEELWRKVPSETGEPFATFSAFVETKPPFGLGYSAKQLEALLRLEHPHEQKRAETRDRMVAMRNQVVRLMQGEISPAAAHGGDRRSELFQVRGTNLKSDTRDRVVAQLKRDDPTLADQVINGEITANAAARQKGWRKPRIVLTSPESIARALRRHLGPDDIAQLIQILLQQP